MCGVGVGVVGEVGADGASGSGGRILVWGCGGELRGDFGAGCEQGGIRSSGTQTIHSLEFRFTSDHERITNILNGYEAKCYCVGPSDFGGVTRGLKFESLHGGFPSRWESMGFCPIDASIRGGQGLPSRFSDKDPSSFGLFLHSGVPLFAYLMLKHYNDKGVNLDTKVLKICHLVKVKDREEDEKQHTMKLRLPK
ncbi:hypothetical protein Tco_0761738 [Tanacetum coccineum]